MIALKDNIRKLKGKAIVDDVVTLHPIDLELLKVDVAQLAPKLQNNRTTHFDYLKHTQEETATLREIVEQERSLNPLNTSLDYACNQIRASPSKEKGNSNNLTVVLATSGCLNVDVILLKKRRWLCGSCLLVPATFVPLCDCLPS
nr:hypothetical protein [Tanacetum cinerariifolium]